MAISIHALRAESDRQYTDGIRNGWDFNPRSPSRERRIFFESRALK